MRHVCPPPAGQTFSGRPFQTSSPESLASMMRSMGEGPESSSSTYRRAGTQRQAAAAAVWACQQRTNSRRVGKQQEGGQAAGGWTNSRGRLRVVSSGQTAGGWTNSRRGCQTRGLSWAGREQQVEPLFGRGLRGWGEGAVFETKRTRAQSHLLFTCSVTAPPHMRRLLALATPPACGVAKLAGPCLPHVPTTCAYHMCLPHVPIICAYHMCLPHVPTYCPTPLLIDPLIN